MCVILIKRKGQKLPKSYLERAFRSNPHGAGLMFCKKGRVEIHKGFMSLPDLARAIADVEAKHDLVIHLRFRSHGAISPALTHPFPLLASRKWLATLDLACDIGIAHNGIIPGFGETDDESTSDTTDFIQVVGSKFNNNLPGLTQVLTAVGGKFAIMTQTGEITTVGNFTKDPATGLVASNNCAFPISLPTKKTGFDWSKYQGNPPKLWDKHDCLLPTDYVYEGKK